MLGALRLNGVATVPASSWTPQNSKVLVCIPNEPVRAFKSEPAEAKMFRPKKPPVPIVFPEMLGTAKVKLYLVQEVERVACWEVMLTIAEPPEPNS
jgi:hypothetical protein